MVLAEGVGPGVPRLGFAAADVTARRAQPKVEAATTFLASVGAGVRPDVRGVRAGGAGGHGIAGQEVHRAHDTPPELVPLWPTTRAAGLGVSCPGWGRGSRDRHGG